MEDPHRALLESLAKFLLSLLVPGGGQLYLGHHVLGVTIYTIVVGGLVLVTRGVVRGAWAIATLLTLAGLVYVAGIVSAWRIQYATLNWFDRPWPVVLCGFGVLVGLLLWLVVPRSGPV